jgi:acetyl-CoA carboxylase carboxyl transferase alpha subunit
MKQFILITVADSWHHFEKPIKELYDQVEQLRITSEKSKTNMSGAIAMLEERIVETKKHITANVSPWQKVQLSRHPDRPYTLKYIANMCTNFVELHGDRNVKDDKAMVGGFAQLGGETVMILGQQKGSNTKTRQLRNFGMANPEGYRKALRLMKLAEKFNKPVNAARSQMVVSAAAARPSIKPVDSRSCDRSGSCLLATCHNGNNNSAKKMLLPTRRLFIGS